MKYEFIAPNQWLTKAGAFLSKSGKPILPIKAILMPMHQASVSIERYKQDKDKPQTMDLIGKRQLIQNIGLNVRSADKAYFNTWSKNIIESNIDNRSAVELFNGCKNCLQSSLSPNSLREYISPKLKELSDLNNSKIIHSMDTGGMIKEKNFNIVFDYYNEFMKINLMHYPEIKSLPIKRCKECLEATGRTD
ncbi:MAG: hypothetical protein HUN04_22315 [Desulfobacter sp.]|nr:MAG: hypothetical protein HUN04_22315 [Desulfobacter sp.]